MMSIKLPAARPNSAEKPLETVCISSTDSGVSIMIRIRLLPAREVLSRPSADQALRFVPPKSSAWCRIRCSASLDARRLKAEVVEVARDDRQGSHRPLVDDGLNGHLAGVGDGRVGDDGDRLLQRPDGHPDVDADLTAHVEHDAGLMEVTNLLSVTVSLYLPICSSGNR